MRRTRALGIGLFLGMTVCLFLGTSEPVGASTCVQDCDATYSACDEFCTRDYPDNAEARDFCTSQCNSGYLYCMRHATWCSSTCSQGHHCNMTCYSPGLPAGMVCWVTSCWCDTWP